MVGGEAWRPLMLCFSSSDGRDLGSMGRLRLGGRNKERG